MKRYELHKMTKRQVLESNFDKVIISVGSCECHGDHLPEGTDTFVSYKLACQVAEKYDDILVIPPITIGYSGHYDTFPFTLTLSYDTTILVLYDVIESILRNGIDKIIIINGHDGNIAPIEIASRKIKEKYENAKIAVLGEWWVTAGQLLPENTFEVWDGLGHGGEGESSIMYYLYPEYCDEEYATSVVPDNLPPHLDIKWDFSEITNTGQTGDATKANADKGKMMNDAIVQAVCEGIDYLNERNWDYKTNIK
ncbi:MAG: creatininase family protein [Tissierellia bacterium]|nr:creatininase family protein [Tissierellia bacterium]